MSRRVSSPGRRAWSAQRARAAPRGRRRRRRRARAATPTRSPSCYRSGTVDAVDGRRRAARGRRHRRARDRRSTSVDTVFHLGAQTLVGAAHGARRCSRSSPTSAGTWNVLEACRRHPTLVRRVVVASSDKAYGAQRRRCPTPRTCRSAAASRTRCRSPCADLDHASPTPTPTACRSRSPAAATSTGRGDLNWSRIVPGTIRSLLRGEQPVLRSDGTFVRDYLHVDDVVDAYLALADGLAHGDLDPGEAFNFSDESPLTVLELYEAICGAAGRPGTEPRILDDAPRRDPRPVARTRRRRGPGSAWKARVGLDDGLAATVAWYRELPRCGDRRPRTAWLSTLERTSCAARSLALVTPLPRGRVRAAAVRARRARPCPVSGKVFDDERDAAARRRARSTSG